MINKLEGPSQELNVMVIPKINSFLLKDDKDSITPIMIKGDGHDLDKKFIETISPPMVKFNKIVLSIAQLEKDLENIEFNDKKTASSEEFVKSNSVNIGLKTHKKIEKIIKETRGDMVFRRGAELEKLGLNFSPKEKSWIKDDFNLHIDEVKALEEKEFSNIIDEITGEFKKRKENPIGKRTANRIAELEKLGFEYDKPKLSYVKNSSEIKMRSINLFTDVEYEKLLVLELEKEMKPEKVEGSDQVNAFSGNADKVGTKNLTQKKNIQAPSDMLKVNKKDPEEKEDFFSTEDNDEKEDLQPNSDFDSEKEEVKEENKTNKSSDEDEISFF